MNAENINLGGWEPCGGKIDEYPDALAAFNKAMQGFIGAEYTPITLVAKQVVSGMNYCILCKVVPATKDPAPYMSLVVIYQDTSGNASITSIKEVVPFVPLVLKGEANAADSAMVGGWKITEGDMSIKFHPDAMQALGKATKGLVGAKYEPLDLLATQIVSGKNYCILCRITPVTLDAKPTMKLVYVYEDLQGNAVITSIKEIIGAPMPGGFIANPGSTDLDSNPDVKTAFETAVNGIMGVNFVPVAYLGSQVVAGKNYLVLCETTIVIPNPQPKLTLVTINVDLGGKASILKTEPLVI